MAFLNQQDLPSLDGFNFTGPTRMMSGVGRTLNPVLDTQHGEKMRWLYVGGTGNVSYVKWDGTTQVLTGLLAGFFHPILSLQINSIGTTATGIVVGS
jgi:hypothetical protein